MAAIPEEIAGHDLLAGKKVVVTAAAGTGIGFATARRALLEGADVLVSDFHERRLGETVDTLKGEFGSQQVESFVCDVSDPQSVERVVGAAQAAFGHIDIAVNSAGVVMLAPAEDLGLDAWDKTIDINLKGTFLTVKHAVPKLKVRGGAVVIVSSVNGTRMFSNSGASAYATSKAGQVAFGRMMALELAKHRIRVNTVCPGAIETNIDDNTRRQNLESAREPALFPQGEIPLTDGRPGTAGQVAELIWFLCSPIATHISGAEVFIDGTQSLLRG